MNDRTLFDAHTLTYVPLTDAERDTLARDALSRALLFARTQLPPAVAERFYDPTLDDARAIIDDTLRHLAFRCSIDFQPSIVCLSDLGAWMVPALLALGLRRERDQLFRWSDGSPINLTGKGESSDADDRSSPL